MKKLILVVLFFFNSIFSNMIKADAEFNEIFIENNSGSKVLLKFYPISGLFNCITFNSNPEIKYSIYNFAYIGTSTSGAPRRNAATAPRIQTITGFDAYALDDPLNNHDGFYQLSNGLECQLSIDGSLSSGQDGVIGFGV